ncbi:lipid IV(A) 3-deoxy-D-manno-octulosonic acid transferase [Kangiella marina]|uniref:3-deoxy-D-manno-octulosonic acid transferase n=2 Tax=Kangiella marina TaxID=1079178 RepID=A0ABP8IFJ1_9GAMM
MGESIAAKAIISKLLAARPHLNIVVTTTTPTGAKQIIEGLGDKVTHHYSPCDLPGTIKRFVKRIRPLGLVIMETELWPNWLYHMRKAKLPVVLANARMSQKSADKYAKISSLSEQMMQSLSLVLAVCENDAERFIHLGVKQKNCLITGNIKFDQHFVPSDINEYFPPWKDDSKGCIWLAASTHKGEDKLLLSAHQKVLKSCPKAKLIIVPRHPERFDEVANLVSEYGLSLARRSQPGSWDGQCDVLLGDTMGELMQAYELSDVAFVAGSLVPIGGHNMIEPAMLGKPVLSGPYVHNFQEIFNELKEHAGIRQADSAEDICREVVELLQSPEQRMAMGANAKMVVERSRGALNRTVEALESFLLDKA